MPIGSKNLAGFLQLKNLDKGALPGVGIALLGIALSAFLLNDLDNRQEALAQLRSDVESKEARGAAIQLPTDDESALWAEREALAENILLLDRDVPQVYEEITRIMTQNRLQRYQVDTVEKTVEGDSAAANSLRALGVERYLEITVRFRAEYRDAAAFVGAIAQLPRSLSIERMELKRDIPLVEGAVVINLYRRGAA